MRTPPPDPAKCKDQLAALQYTLRCYGPEHFLGAFFWILIKLPQRFSSGREEILVPFRPNREQRHLLKNIARNNLLLKARQIGSTTWFLLARLLLPAVTEPGTGSLLISQSAEYAEKHFQIARRAYRYFGVADPANSEANLLNQSLRQNLLHTEYSNKKELIFDQLESKVMIATAEVEESGQGPTLHHIVASEYSRWPHNPPETLSNVRGALVKTGTLDKECTANGAAGAFFEDSMKALNDPQNADSRFHFYPWYWQDDYYLDMTEVEKDEMEKDLTADELRLIARMHKELEEVA